MSVSVNAYIGASQNNNGGLILSGRRGLPCRYSASPKGNDMAYHAESMGTFLYNNKQDIISYDKQFKVGYY